MNQLNSDKNSLVVSQKRRELTGTWWGDVTAYLLLRTHYSLATYQGALITVFLTFHGLSPHPSSYIQSNVRKSCQQQRSVKLPG